MKNEGVFGLFFVFHFKLIFFSSIITKISDFVHFISSFQDFVKAIMEMRKPFSICKLKIHIGLFRFPCLKYYWRKGTVHILVEEKPKVCIIFRVSG